MQQADQANDIAMDEADNIYVTGISRIAEYTDAMVTVKYTSDGTFVWAGIYNSEDYAVGKVVEIDQWGNVIVAGSSSDFLLVSYDPEGNINWENSYDGPAEEWDTVSDMYIDANGFIYITGESDGTPGGGWYDNDYATIKYDQNGNELWVSRLDGAGNADIPYKIKTDNAGNVYVTGRKRIGSGDSDFMTVKYNSEGLEEWVEIYDCNTWSGDEDQGRCMAIDGDGNIYIAGWGEYSETGADYVLLKYSPEGTLIWEENYNRSGENGDYVTAMAIFENNIFLTGYSDNDDYTSDILTLCYNLNGNLLWSAVYDGPAHHDDEPTDIICDATGNLFITGMTTYMYSLPHVWTECVTIKYNIEGESEWVKFYRGPQESYDAGKAVALDSEGNICLTGDTQSDGWIGANWDYLVCKYSQLQGIVSCQLTPESQNIQIPANGGSFNYGFSIDNGLEETISIDYWCEVTLPGGMLIENILPPTNIVLPPRGVSILFVQQVPERAPASTYTFRGLIGTYPEIWVIDEFQFEKEWYVDTGQELIDTPISEFPYSIITDEKITDFSLNAYPNPFNPTTTISYSISEAGNVNMTVYDPTGSKVATLVDGYRTAGAYEVTFDGTDLASGVYLYRLEAGESIVSGKMVLLK